MRLETFRVMNFRSINDSQSIAVSRITALLGRNESGKSNLLKALSSLNPPDGFKPLVPIKDFPRHRRLSECRDKTPVIESLWILDDDDRLALTEIWPRACQVTQASIARCYGPNRSVGFINLQEYSFDVSDIKAKIKKIAAATRVAADALDDPRKSQLYTAVDAFEQVVTPSTNQMKWAEGTKTGLQDLRKAFVQGGIELDSKHEQFLSDLEELSLSILGDEAACAKAKQWILEHMPIFIYLDEYPELDGHQDIGQLLDRKNRNCPTESDKSFEKLCKVAGLDPKPSLDP